MSNKDIDYGKFWSLAFDSMSDFVFLLDNHFHIVKANKSFYDFCGKDSKSLDQWHCYNLVHNRDCPFPNCPHERLLKTKSFEREEFYEPYLERWLLVGTTPIFDDKSNVVGSIHIATDITVRKKIESVLSKERQEREAILDSVPAWVFFKDKENRFIYVNKVFADIMGMAKKDLEGKSLFDLYPKFMAEEYWRADKEVFESGIAKTGIIEYIDTKRGRLWVKTDKFPYRDKDGGIIGIIGFAVDRTESRLIEEERESLLYELSRQTQELSCFYEIARLAEIPEKTLQDICAAIVRIILPERCMQQEVACARIIFNGKEFKTDKFKISDKKVSAAIKVFENDLGAIEVFHIADNWQGNIENFLKEENEFIVAVAEHLRKIAERKRLEQALIDNEKRLNIIFNSILTGVVIVDAQTHKIVDVNPVAATMIGAPREDIIGRVCHKFICPADIGKCPVTDLGEVVEKSERKLLKANGEELAVLKTASCMEFDGRRYIIDSFIDIDDRKKREEDLKQAKEELEIQSWGLAKANDGIRLLYKELERRNDKLKELDRLKDDFLNTVSHELRTPMTSIREVNSQMLDGILGETTEKQKKFLSISLRNIDRLKHIIDNLLDVSKLEAGRTQFKKEVVDLVALIQGIILSFTPQAEKKGLALKTSFSNKSIDGYIDRDKIIQVFTNLIGNSLKFTEKGSIEVGVVEKSDGIECFVVDTGRGIEEKDLTKTFSKFEQFGRTDGPGEKGTGLGLAITKGIIEGHGGRIWVESKFGEWTKISFLLSKYGKIDVVVDNIQRLLNLEKNINKEFLIYLFKIHNYNEIESKLGKDTAYNMLMNIEKEIGSMIEYNGLVSATDNEEIIIVMNASKKDSHDMRRFFSRIIKGALFEADEQLEFDFSYGYSAYPFYGDKASILLSKARENLISEQKERMAKEILIVDDEEMIRKSLKAILKNLGYTNITEASNGEIALEQIKSATPGLVILDINMPGMNGYEVIGRLKEDVKTEDVPVLIVSGYTVDFERLNGYIKEKAILTISKPFDAIQIKKLVYYLL